MSDFANQTGSEEDPLQQSAAERAAFLSSISKRALAELRMAQYDSEETKIALIRYFSSGRRGNLSFDELNHTMFLEPNAICFRVGYSLTQSKHIFDIARILTLLEIMSYQALEDSGPPS